MKIKTKKPGNDTRSTEQLIQAVNHAMQKRENLCRDALRAANKEIERLNKLIALRTSEIKKLRKGQR